MEQTVSQIAESVGLPRRTVRYYDRIGLVSPAARSNAGYRLYDAQDEGKLRFVRQAKALGFSLKKIQQLIAAAENGCCGEVVPELHRLLQGKIIEIDERIDQLRAFRQRLVEYAQGKADGCGCQGHDVFCDCLSDVPLLQINDRMEANRHV